jgi:putative oxidoreductase
MSTTTLSGTPSTAAPAKGWTIGLWVAQALLALAFGLAGAMKIATPIAELAQKLPWVTDLPNLVRFIGVSELLGAFGLILPAATRIRPILTPIAAMGLVLVMVLAAGFHLLRGEAQALPVNLALGAIAALVAWGRLRKAPIAPRR